VSHFYIHTYIACSVLSVTCSGPLVWSLRPVFIRFALVCTHCSY